MIKDLLQPWDWICSLDLKDPYLTVPIAKNIANVSIFYGMPEYLNLLASPLDSESS